VGNIDLAWDGYKARSNLSKHGVSFEEAHTVFLHLNGPDCYREADSVIRLISARRAAPQEEKVYWSFR